MFDLKEFCTSEKVVAFCDKKIMTATYVELFSLIVISFISLICDGFLIGSEVMASIINGNKIVKALIFIFAFVLHATTELFWAVSIFKRLDEKNNKLIIADDRIIEIGYAKTKVETKEVLIENISDFTYRNNSLKVVIDNEREVFCGFTLTEDAIIFLNQKIKKVGL